jgi:hypothetical protein
VIPVLTLVALLGLAVAACWWAARDDRHHPHADDLHQLRARHPMRRSEPKDDS